MRVKPQTLSTFEVELSLGFQSSTPPPRGGRGGGERWAPYRTISFFEMPQRFFNPHRILKILDLKQMTPSWPMANRSLNTKTAVRKRKLQLSCPQTPPPPKDTVGENFCFLGKRKHGSHFGTLICK